MSCLGTLRDCRHARANQPVRGVISAGGLLAAFMALPLLLMGAAILSLPPPKPKD